jgi:transcriptional regulator with XRE-family HTH domain
MTEEILPGGMIMVKIDGAKVKRLREQQGLTQLYVATAVQVTTDTISRWENKRYPSVKKENCLRLAEALGVSLEEILEQKEDTDEAPATEQTAELPADAGPAARWPRRKMLVLAGCLLLAAVAATASTWYFFLRADNTPITARRILPRHCLPGQPFPVVIEVTDTPEKPVTLIIREMLPEGAVLKKTSPALSTPVEKGRELKWLEKISGPTRFIYTVTLKGKPEDVFKFSGNIAVSQDSEKARDVVGNNSIKIRTFHWADSDADGILSDKEMLVVHDQYSGAEKLGIDVNQIEKIWLGSGYRWDTKKLIYEILP